MPGRFFAQFRAVDFFGKAVPGTVAGALILSIIPLPKTTVNNIIDTGSILIQNITALLILLIGIIILSFVIGQALDTMGIIAERTLYAVGDAVARVYRYLLRDSNRLTNEYPGKKYFTQYRRMDEGELEDKSYSEVRMLELQDWLYTRFDAARRIFKPHRSLFCERLNQKKYTVESKLFEESIPDSLDDENKYIFALSVVDRSGYNRANRLQVNFTLCRSIWVTLLVFSFVWWCISLNINFSMLPFLTEPLFDRIPFILQIPGITRSDVTQLSYLLLLLSIIFMYASVEYKGLYPEYVVSDFINAANEITYQQPISMGDNFGYD